MKICFLSRARLKKKKKESSEKQNRSHPRQSQGKVSNSRASHVGLEKTKTDQLVCSSRRHELFLSRVTEMMVWPAVRGLLWKKHLPQRCTSRKHFPSNLKWISLAETNSIFLLLPIANLGKQLFLSSLHPSKWLLASPIPCATPSSIRLSTQDLSLHCKADLFRFWSIYSRSVKQKQLYSTGKATNSPGKSTNFNSSQLAEFHSHQLHHLQSHFRAFRVSNVNPILL